MKQKIEIKSITEKQTQKGASYLSIDSNIGKLNCFEGSCIIKIKETPLDKGFEVEIKEYNGYKNIVNIYDIIDIPGFKSAENQYLDKQETITNQWAIYAAMETLKLNNIIIIDRDKLISEIRETAIKLKEMSRSLK